MFNKETFKTILIIALFVSSIVLTTNIFIKVETYSKIDNAPEEVWANEEINIRQFFNPQGYHVNFGGGLYSMIYDSQIFNRLNTEVIAFLESSLDNNKIQPSNYDEYLKANKNKGVKLILPYDMKLDQILSLVKNSTIEFEETYRVKELIISNDDFIYIKFDENYYKIPYEISFSSLNKTINDIETSTNITEYKRIESIYSLKNILGNQDDFKENNVLIPINKVNKIPILRVSKEVEISEEDNSNATEYGYKIFGNNFNFIRKMVDIDGSVVYMYGYGDKALKIGLDGAFEYKEKLDEGSNINSLSFNEGLQRSINVLNTIKDVPESIYLSNYYTYQKNGNEIQRYEFNYKISNYNVIIDNELNGTCAVELYGDQVIFFYRKLREDVQVLNIDEIWKESLSINEIINNNFYTIANDYIYDEENDSERDKIQDYIYNIIQDIKSARINYFLDSNENTERLIPVWEIKINQYRYYFNIYDGNLEKRIVEEK